jgi:trimeric autotransporter adhesin
MRRVLSLCFCLLLVCSTTFTMAQQSNTASSAASTVPHFINYSGVLTALNSQPLSGIQGATFLLYANQDGGAPLWMETQNVTLSKNGQYTVTLGTTTSQGLPSDIFASGDARWLAVQVSGQPEQPRVLLVAVPYALKAADAQTIGGLPPSAFVLAAPPVAGTTNTTIVAASSTSNTLPPPPSSNVTTSGGTVNTVPLWDAATDITNSIMTQTGSGSTGRIGFGTTTPASTIDVNGAATVRGLLNLPWNGFATAAGGRNSQPLSIDASAFNSSLGNPVGQNFRWMAEPVGNNTASPSGTLNLLFAEGPASPRETGFHIASNGLVTFAVGQIFPGTGNGTITGVIAGTDLKGGGSSGNVTLNLDTTKVPQLASSNTFTGTQTINNIEFIKAANATSSLQVTNTLTSGAASAILGTTDGSGSGVFGETLSGAGYGIQGIGGIGVSGTSAVCAGNVNASCPGGSFNGFNAASLDNQPGGDGVDAFGGSSGPDFSGGNGIVGTGGKADVLGGGIGGTGVLGIGGTGSADSGDGVGGFFFGASTSGGIFGDGLDAVAGDGLGGNISGDLFVSGQIFAGTKDFKIDHPTDPANKYLVHASVESSEMMNIYTGNITTDARGSAVVDLPDWFEVLNTDFRYQLTVIGQFAQAIVARKIENHQFLIKTSVPNVEVSWQVTGVRQDAFAKSHPLVVEQQKEARLRGYYIHPELYGAPAEKQIEWARHPQMMKRLRAARVANGEGSVVGIGGK